MKTLTARIAALGVAVAIAGSVALAQIYSKDASGTWMMSTASPMGTMTSTLYLKQEGKALSGSIAIDQVGSYNISGEASADTVYFSFPIEVQGMSMQIDAYGVISDSVTMNGMMSAGSDVGSFPFSAKREAKAK